MYKKKQYLLIMVLILIFLCCACNKSILEEESAANELVDNVTVFNEDTLRESIETESSFEDIVEADTSIEEIEVITSKGVPQFLLEIADIVVIEESDFILWDSHSFHKSYEPEGFVVNW